MSENKGNNKLDLDAFTFVPPGPMSWDIQDEIASKAEDKAGFISGEIMEFPKNGERVIPDLVQSIHSTETVQQEDNAVVEEPQEIQEIQEPNEVQDIKETDKTQKNEETQEINKKEKVKKELKLKRVKPELLVHVVVEGSISAPWLSI